MAKHYYSVPSEKFSIGGRPAQRPLCAGHVDSNGGLWKTVVVDSDTDATFFVVVVTDKRGAGDPPKPDVHGKIGANVPGAHRHTGATFTEVKNSIKAKHGAVHAARALDQNWDWE